MVTVKRSGDAVMLRLVRGPDRRRAPRVGADRRRGLRAAEMIERRGEAVELPAEVSRGVLIPNERGLDNALEHRDRFDEVNVFLSASETHNRKNVNRSVAESLEGLRRVLDKGGACAEYVAAPPLPSPGPRAPSRWRKPPPSQ